MIFAALIFLYCERTCNSTNVLASKWPISANFAQREPMGQIKSDGPSDFFSRTVISHCVKNYFQA